MFVFHFVKRLAADQRCNSHDQLMFYIDVERVDAVVANAAVNVVFFAVGILTVAVVVDNDDVKNDNFNKIII